MSGSRTTSSALQRMSRGLCSWWSRATLPFRPLPVLFVRVSPREIDCQALSNELFDVGASIKEHDLIRCPGEGCCEAVEEILDNHGIEHERDEWKYRPCMNSLERDIMRGYLKRFNDGLDLYR